MNHRLLINYNKLLKYLLAILGIGGACTFSGCLYGSPVEYGSPHATYKVTGKVTSEQNIKIPNIQVIMEYDTSYTDNDGNYFVWAEEFPGDQDFNIKFIDVDGEANGIFQPKDTTVNFINPEFIDGDGAWYNGETSKEMNVRLKEKGN